MPDADAVQESIDRIGDLLSEIHDTLARFNRAAAALEELTAKTNHADIVGRLTDERFRTVTR